MLAGPGQPGGDRALAMAKHPHSCGETQAFRERGQHLGDTIGRRFEALAWRVAAGRERRPTGLAAKGLDALPRTMDAVADEGMDVGIGDVVIRTGRVGTGEAVHRNAFWCPASALQLTPWLNHGRRWRSAGADELSRWACCRRVHSTISPSRPSRSVMNSEETVPAIRTPFVQQVKTDG